MPLAERIKQVRQVFGLTQGKFAERIAISPSHLAGMELGSKKIYERTIRLICMEFNINEHWLKTGEGSMFNNVTDSKLLNANSLFKSLSPLFQDCALNMLSDLSELQDSIIKVE